ncbi:hypothetical protein [Enterobacter hormaechei]|uniref:hypothetical protein n=1 Tax=Enterobacter hormaechei TaxID=158836 RepID=UPI00069A0106|nr:hypothetical protein [Enterobacter hormaechei]HEM8722211.1 hypothetical protein [Enterobacter hormaechei]
MSELFTSVPACQKRKPVVLLLSILFGPSFVIQAWLSEFHLTGEKMKLSTVIKAVPVLIVLALSGCSSYQHVTLRQESGLTGEVWRTTPPLTAGDHIQYSLKDGSEGEIVFRHITDETLTAQDGSSIPLGQVVKLEKKQFSGGKSVAATGAGIGVVAIVVVGVMAAGLATALVAAGG